MGFMLFLQNKEKTAHEWGGFEMNYSAQSTSAET